jgi:hypothetical protein
MRAGLEAFSTPFTVLAGSQRKQRLLWEEMEFHIESMAEDWPRKACPSRTRAPRLTESLAI